MYLGLERCAMFFDCMYDVRCSESWINTYDVHSATIMGQTLKFFRSGIMVPWIAL